jgi:hypothetical protein
MDANIIETAVAIELECAGLYEVFAQRFSGKPEFVTFWRLYAEAERYHGATIRVHQMAFADRIAQEQLAASPVEMVELLTYIRSHRARYERETLSAEEALGIARHIETSSAELHGRTQFFAHLPEYAEFFEKMSEEDRAHREVLDTAVRKFSQDA